MIALHSLSFQCFPFDKIILAFEELNAEKLILTHIGDDIEEHVRSYFGGRVVKEGKKIIVAYDGMTVGPDEI